MSAAAAAQSQSWDDGSVPFVVMPPEVAEHAKQAGVSDGNQTRTYPWTAQRVL